MIQPELLNLYLSIWSQWVMQDQALLRSLWYPLHTAVEGYAKRGGVPSTRPNILLSPDMDGQEIAQQVDKTMAQLRSLHEPWYHALFLHCLSEGPDEHRAQLLRLTLKAFRKDLYAARRWMRVNLEA